jgi:3-keto-L-gulonate-6-phosphate decarboxylase
MKFQLAMDMANEDLFWSVLYKTHDLIDIVEIGNVGTYLGAQMIPRVRARYPKLEILWDQNVKFLDANIPPIDLGADYVTVDADATDEEFMLHLEYAHKLNCKVVASMNDDTAGSAQMIRLEKLGVDEIAFHPNVYHNQYPVGDVLQLKIAKLVTNRTKLLAYGGFTLDNIFPVVELKPDVICVGGAIWHSADPRKVAQQFVEVLKRSDSDRISGNMVWK